MSRKLLLGVLAAAFGTAVTVASAQGPANAGQAAAPAGRAGAAGGQRGNAIGDPANTFGTSDTLYTMPEAGQGGGAGDPTAEQLAASPEAQAFIANAKEAGEREQIEEPVGPAPFNWMDDE